MANLQIGVGLRPTHYPFLENDPELKVDFFEALSENYMESEGRPLDMLLKIRANRPVALHGVGMNLGGYAEPDPAYLRKLKLLIEKTEPFLVSDHLCWTGTPGLPVHDLLPLPYTRESAETVSRNIHIAQDFLGRALMIENVSSYIRYRHSEMSEWEFIAEIQKRTGCHLLLDLNNVYVSAQNHGYRPETFIAGIPLSSVRQIHLAGHSDTGEFLFDTHSAPVCGDVWGLVKHTSERMDAAPAVLVEWDENIPDWPELEAEALKIKSFWRAR